MLVTIGTETLQETLLAVQDLRRKYLNKTMITPYRGSTNPDDSESQSCPLCRLTNLTCSLCPWVWFERKKCFARFDATGNYVGDYHEHYIIDRLARIDRWENAIVKELAARRAA